MKKKLFFKGWLEEEAAFCHPGRRRRRRVHECLQTQEEAAQSECMTCTQTSKWKEKIRVWESIARVSFFPPCKIKWEKYLLF